jgi:hypothetical protein
LVGTGATGPTGITGIYGPGISYYFAANVTTPPITSGGFTLPLGDTILYDQTSGFIFGEPGVTMPAVMNSNTMAGGLWIHPGDGSLSSSPLPLPLTFEVYKNGLSTGFKTGPVTSYGYAQFLPTYAALTLAPGDTITVLFSGEIILNELFLVGDVSVMLQAN